jgi:DNA polymerase
MSHFQNALAATEEHLRALKSNGVRYLHVQSETLRALKDPVPERIGNGEFGGVHGEEEAVVAVAEKLEVTVVLEEPAPKAVAAPGVSMPGDNAVDKRAAMAALRERTVVCVKCPHLVKSRQTVVFGVGDVDAPLMFVGEAPGADEDRRGEPFVGAAGQLLTKIIAAMGFSRETVYIANILKCRPDTPGQTSGNRKPTPEEMTTCLPWLLEQVDLVKPRVLVALGATAVEGLLGKGEGITRLRGHFQSYRGIPLMPTFHPSYLLHNQAMTEKRKVWEDMLQVLEKLGAPITEKQRGFFLRGQ